ncbi:MAG: phosphoglucomutase/phosphomannomutase family protein [Chloroflexi bacterium]|nr:phosphoglucomutase/phosphomannomutase family protein [Chloroflexota bacterium]
MAQGSAVRPIKFGTDGWRAIIAEDFTFANVRVCAQGLADELNASGDARKGVVVAYDTRFASERFADAVAEVMAANGITTHLVDRPTPTPAGSYAVTHLKAGGAALITASHNPGSYNGFKVKTPLGNSAPPEMVAKLEERIGQVFGGRSQVKRSRLSDAIRAGMVRKFDPIPAYLAQMERLLDLKRFRQARLKVVVDSMYGAGAGYLPALLKGANLEVEEIHGERNPAFPGFAQPEPVASNLKQLSDAVRSRAADIGLALDGDADRLGVIDETGRYLTTLEAFSLIAHHLLGRRGERGAIVCTITMSSMVERLGEKYGVDVPRTPVGFKFVGPKMLELKALMGGEESGGYAFRGHIPERDGILSGLLVLEAVVTTGKRPSELLKELHAVTGPHYFERVDLQFDEAKRGEIQKRVTEANPQEVGGLRVERIDRSDGIRLLFGGGAWTVMRFSGTEPLIRVYAEAANREQVDRLLKSLRELAGV